MDDELSDVQKAEQQADFELRQRQVTALLQSVSWRIHPHVPLAFNRQVKLLPPVPFTNADLTRGKRDGE